jgi:double-strand break repair protein MRE11
VAAQRRLKTVTSEVPAEGTEPAENLHVEDLVSQYLGCQKLDLFPQNEFGDILRTSIEKTDHGLIERFVNDSLLRIMEKSNADTVQDSVRLRGEFDRIKRAREDEWRRLHPTIESVLLNVGQMRDAPEEQDDSDGDEDSEAVKPKATATRGRGRGRGAAAAASTRGTSTRGRGRGKTTAPTMTPSKRAPIELMSDEGDDDALFDEENMAPVVAATKSLVLEPAAPAAAKKASASTAGKTAWPPRRK